MTATLVCTECGNDDAAAEGLCADCAHLARTYRDGWQAGADAVQHTIKRLLDTSGYGYVSWRDVLAEIDATREKGPKRP